MAGYLAFVAEATSALSGALIISCLLLVTLLILRFQHGEPASSVVRVQHEPVQVAVQKLFVPYTLQLCTGGASSGEDKFCNVRVRCGASGRGCLVRWWWGVERRALSSLLHAHWQQFKTSVSEDIAFPGLRSQSAQLKEGNHELELRSSEVLRLGPLPRERYPLVVVQLDTARQHCDSQLGSVVTVLHVPDADCPDPSRVLYQYLKQCTGQLTMLTTLYTQSNGVNPSAPSASQESEEDTRENSATNVGSEPTTSVRPPAHTAANTSESLRNKTDSESVLARKAADTENVGVETADGNLGKVHSSFKSKFNDKNRVTEFNDGEIESIGDKNNVGETGASNKPEDFSDCEELILESKELHQSNSEGTKSQNAECGSYSSDIVDVCLKKRFSKTQSNEDDALSSSGHGSQLSSLSRKEFDNSDRSKPSITGSVKSASSLVLHPTKPSNDLHASSTSGSLVNDHKQSCFVPSQQQTLPLNLGQDIGTPSNLEGNVNSASSETFDPHRTTVDESSPGGAALPPLATADELSERASVSRSDFSTEPLSDATESPLLDTAESPLLDTAESSSDTVAEPSSDTAAEPSSDAAAEPSSDAAAEPSSDAAAEPESDECVVCQVERVAVALLPCCHVCVCFSCFSHLMARRQTCPLCRQHVSAYFVV